MGTFDDIVAPLTSLGSYHLFAWGSLVGTELYQSFVMTKLCYLHLPRPQFTTLQRRVFPVYFSLQTGLVAATALTYPSGSILGLADNVVDATILGVTLGLSVLNAFVFGPRTSQAMVERAHQETRDGRRHDEVEGTISEAMKLLKRKFSRNHAMTIHLNFITIIATVVYGLRLGLKLA
ncbi:hypothetical protein G7Y89_g7147 [Cudoniella acicularis]|uniref:TMEM205-like domain-containing protein n=1 Tax=Cudoniella acicularis TaxID=354080 RepID=A0A8H4W281_9HELO|nr:hypothetical protein G7Y89_g7147 [Cudoniella acicularis]